MKENNLLSKIKKKKYKSYKRTVGKIVDNIINQDFNANSINQKWVSTSLNLE